MRHIVKPTILVFTGHYLPGYKAGGILRSVENAVNHLHGDFQFRIVTRDRDLGDEEPYPSIKHKEWQTVGNASVYYLPPGGESLAQLRAIVCSTQHDLIRLNSFFDPLTVKVLLNRRLGQIDRKPMVLYPFGEFAWASLRQKYPKKALFMRLARLTGLYAPVTWHASSTLEADDIANVMKIRREAIRVAGDLPTVYGNGTEEAASSWQVPARDGLRVTFFSRISPEKNLDFALKILSQVRSKVAFDIIGPVEDTAYWTKCQELIRELPAYVTVRSLGGIEPSQVMTSLSQYDLMLFPTGGEAYGHVIAESLTAGTPVLVSTNTPWRNLEAKGLGWDLPLDDIASFVRVIDELGSTDEQAHLERRRMVKENMRRLLAESSVVEGYRQLYYEALAAPKAR
ncbi:MAG: glycosyltransferase family 4 protein [Acidobacteriota bacterium]|jgi:glycosyltransferase involved in cell wall biosynthesis